MTEYERMSDRGNSPDASAPDNVYGESVDLPELVDLLVETYRADKRTYDPEERPLTAGRLTALFTPNLESPVFVVGSPRSGTSFLGEAIGAVPGIGYHHEPIATKAATRFVWRDRWSEARSRVFFRLVFGFLAAIHLDGDQRFAQKTPRHAFIADSLYRWFDDPKLIHLLRDGRDVAVSYAEKPWLSASASDGAVEPGGAPHGPHPRFWVEPERHSEFRETSDIHRCIWAWRRFVEAARENFRSCPEEATATVRYERLVREPDIVAGELAEFLEIESERRRNALVEALGEARSESVGRGRRELDERQRETVRREAGDLLDELGYADGGG